MGERSRAAALYVLGGAISNLSPFPREAARFGLLMARVPVYVSGVRTLSIAVVLSLAFGCASTDDPRATTASSWLSALSKRDATAAYALLDAATRKKLAELYDVMRDTRERIQREVPPKSRAAALEATGLTRFPDGGAESLFAELFAAGGSPAELGALASFGLRPKQLDGESGQATVTTLGGDSVALVQDESGAWRVSLGSEDLARLDSLIATANQNQARVNETLRALGQLRYGAK